MPVRWIWVILTIWLVGSLIGALVWLGRMPPRAQAALPGDGSKTAPAGVLRIGLVPERDIFAQRKRHQLLGAYLSQKLQRPVQLVTLNTYQAVLEEFAQRRIDCAFLGSLVAVLTMDRLGAQPIVRPQMQGGSGMYRGVIFVLVDSPVQTLADLRGRSVAMVKTTTAGSLFPVMEMHRLGLLQGSDRPRFVWAGTHDDAIMAVLEGQAEAGAVKDLRLEAFEHAHPKYEIRRLAISEPVPDNALVVRKDLVEALGPVLRQTLLTMNQEEEGRKVLAEYGAERFLPCGAQEYSAAYGMIEQVGAAWEQVGIAGAAPKRTEKRNGE